MKSKKKNFIIIAVIAIIVAVIAIVIIKNSYSNAEKLNTSDIDLSVATLEERTETAIDNAINRLSNSGLTVIKNGSTVAGDFNGYKISVDGQNMEIYYAEMYKFTKIIKSGSKNGEAELEINGKTVSAITYGNVFILKCDDGTVKDSIIKALSTRQVTKGEEEGINDTNIIYTEKD